MPKIWIEDYSPRGLTVWFDDHRKGCSKEIEISDNDYWWIKSLEEEYSDLQEYLHKIYG